MALGLAESCPYLSQGFPLDGQLNLITTCVWLCNCFQIIASFCLAFLAFSRKIKVALNKLTLFAQNSIVPVGLMLVSDQDGISRMNYMRTSSGYVLVKRRLHLGGFPGGSDGKASVCNAGDPGSIPGWGRFPGEGNGNPLQNPCLENPMDKESWQARSIGLQTVGYN